MKVLISSHAFAPSIGGIETVSALLADEFVRLGHAVTLLTQSPGGGKFSFPVVRQPSLGGLREALRWCDIFWQNNLSLRTLWPAILLRRPVVVTHQGSYCRRPSGIDFVQRLKHAIVQRTTSVAISQAVANCFSDVDSHVIPNPFDARLFTAGPPLTQRPNDLIFVGRLVAEKGLDLLLETLALLRGENMSPRLTIVGNGPEAENAKQTATRLGLDEQVIFAGAKAGRDLVTTLQQHKILVVPSRYDEPFGVVALEGIATGCVVIGSSGGGLPEAIGPCGLTFPNGNVAALAEQIAHTLRSPNECENLIAQAGPHLARFHPTRVAEAYLALFQSKLP